MKYNNNTSSGHVRDTKKKNELLYADERREAAWKARVEEESRKKKNKARNQRP